MPSTDDSNETSSLEAAAGGNDQAKMLNPDVLISLTAPKRCSRGFHGRGHYVVQRFMPPELLRKYGLGTAHVDATVNMFLQLSLVELDNNAGGAAVGNACAAATAQQHNCCIQPNDMVPMA